jgi:hypothetical protein
MLINLKELRKKWLWLISKYYSGIRVVAVRESTKDLRIIGAPPEIRRGPLPNTDQKRYHFSNPARSCRS